MKRARYKVLLIIFIITLIIWDFNIIDKIFYEDDVDVKISTYYEKEETEKKIDVENDYIGIINIPSIKLKQGFYHQLSSKNKLKSGMKNIKDDMNNLLVLASHSGVSKIAKFNNLRKMKKFDEIQLSYNNHNYTYLFDHYYKVQKTGHIYIKYDTSKKALILITCDLRDNDKQIVYVAYMT